MIISNVWSRILVGAVFLPVIVGLAWVGGIPFVAFVTLTACIGYWEFCRIAQAKNLEPERAIGLVGILALSIDAWRHSTPGLLPILTAITLCVGVAGIWRKGERSPLINASATLFGVLYIGGLLSHLILLRSLPVTKGLDTGELGSVLLAFVIPWSCDTAAYFTGRAIGRHKLIPRISAGKTIEGTVGGVIGAMVGLLALRANLFPFLSIAECLILGTVGAVVAQLGDLTESLFKRDAGVKDSSHLIPGHGGVLDRFDSVLFVAPCMYYYLCYRHLLFH